MTVGIIQLELEVAAEHNDVNLREEFVPEMVSSPRASQGSGDCAQAGPPPAYGSATGSANVDASRRPASSQAKRGTGTNEATFSRPHADPPTIQDGESRGEAKDPPSMEPDMSMESGLSSMKAMRDAIDGVKERMGSIEDEMDEMKDEVDSVKDRMKKMEDLLEKFEHNFGHWADEREEVEDELQETLDEMSDKLCRVEKGMETTTTTNKNLLVTVEGYRKMLHNVKKRCDSQKEISDTLALTIEELKEWWSEKFQGTEDHADAADREVGDLLESFGAKLEAGKADIEKMLEKCISIDDIPNIDDVGSSNRDGELFLYLNMSNNSAHQTVFRQKDCASSEKY